MDKVYCVYIMTNFRHTVFYTGMTGDLKKWVYCHKAGYGGVFSSKYKTRKLVYFEPCQEPMGAIQREKQIKGGSRADKMRLIESMNPIWRDLYDEI